jgi:small subunit ribosomal protein S16
MVVIRLARGGRKNTPFYRITVAEKSAAVKGNFIERIGLYKPNMGKNEFTLDRVRYDYWVSKGAQPTPRVKLLVKNAGQGKPAKPKKAKAETTEAAAPAAG